MAQKINPDSLRLGITKGWRSRWFPKGTFGSQLEEDVLIRKIIEKKIKSAGIVSIEIERNANNAFKVFIKAAKPGIVIGRGGKGIEELSQVVVKDLQKLFRKRKQYDEKVVISINVEELKRTEVSAQYVAQSVAWDIEKRLPFRRAMKRAVEISMQNNQVKGIKIQLAGRLNGADIARTEVLSNGKLPLQTLRANIDYGFVEANTTYGVIGVKVWVFKGLIFDKDKK
ncbi:MAG: 30S ribosomal protein S3 [Candidatus Harrisonbacteria bacterium CG10_big_fil_rev_8_21_14_0_10_38_8]|uniref:Small ribosomal subunit protein uS3 n=1 Tax=Candidatus Harrisonbacteria bacterium CG10_big_fil_rev_8_21_14_0_10_38_8 TaxID=1974582 RepID=A0A2M6WK51_9BACT|nr:MAG: 30S ribosomal protein S3 [Candidatus Harrisonbacteria bacterium CG10_big_fil_rev_8_21_14_0_10_38_8]